MVSSVQVLRDIAIFLAMLVVCFFAGRWSKPAKENTTIVERRDTVWVCDTLVEEKPVYVRQTVVDTMLVPVRDTISLHDTTYIALERTQREYVGEDYRALVSGYNPALDRIEVFPKTAYITNTVTKPARKWGIGVQAGYGVGKNGFTPYVGIGVSYNIIRF